MSNEHACIGGIKCGVASSEFWLEISTAIVDGAILGRPFLSRRLGNAKRDTTFVCQSLRGESCANREDQGIRYTVATYVLVQDIDCE